MAMGGGSELFKLEVKSQCRIYDGCFYMYLL